LEGLELATLGWVHWPNTQRIHGYLGHIPPAEFEASFNAGEIGHSQLVESNSASPYQTQGDSLELLKPFGAFCF
jgi:hypothetical protein